MTLSYQGASSDRIVGKGMFVPAYIATVGTTADATTTVNGRMIDCRDGQMSAQSAAFAVTLGTGTSPTLTMALQATMDGTNWFACNGSGGTAISTGAVDIATASTNTVVRQLETGTYGRNSFPYLGTRWQLVVGGTSGGWLGTVSAGAVRNAY